MSSTFFRITLIRSAIGLPSKSLNVLKALGLRKRMATVFHPVTPAVAGQIMKVKELVAVSEVNEPMTRAEVHRARVPEKGFYVESKMIDGQRVKIEEGKYRHPKRANQFANSNERGLSSRLQQSSSQDKDPLDGTKSLG
jgi:large subunit ribosomal protein L30